jgi:hypothetical protein
MGFIPMYKVMGLFIFFTSLLLTVWGEFQLIITVCMPESGYHSKISRIQGLDVECIGFPRSHCRGVCQTDRGCRHQHQAEPWWPPKAAEEEKDDTCVFEGKITFI